jgi:diketogulonate reductase-like aldo/keto reductase
LARYNQVSVLVYDVFIVFITYCIIISNGPNNPEIRRDTWRAMEELYNQGKCKAIGVSNYTIKHLNEMISGKYKVNIMPMVNQFELHPYLTQKELIQFCKDHNIIVESYSPFAKGKVSLFVTIYYYDLNGNFYIANR